MQQAAPKRRMRKEISVYANDISSGNAPLWSCYEEQYFTQNCKPLQNEEILSQDQKNAMVRPTPTMTF